MSEVVVGFLKISYEHDRKYCSKPESFEMKFTLATALPIFDTKSICEIVVTKILNIG